MPVLRVLEEEEQGDREDDWGRREEIKGLRNYATLRLPRTTCTVNLLNLLRPNIQYYTNHAFINYVEAVGNRSTPGCRRNSRRYFCDIALMLSHLNLKKKKDRQS